ncbi:MULTISPECIES: hypothetical protein [Pseudomonas]|uniref:hypothetical protein n=1 Tax=Pseudomonas TaxID=286 RepID=UPI001AE46CD5|nr:MULTISPECIES: hypothetical protein [unclassified Pseudomonas]MBP1127131.1 hypothetical protein [Pseudomonas sp. PvP025]MDQ0400991.1 hypothetical protein [Pseudomonas sp. PvP006]
MYYYIEPEVAGGLGDSTVMDTSVHPPKVTALEYRFEGWLGDALLESFPCFIVSDSLAIAIGEYRLSGVFFEDVLITKSDEFEEINPDITLPKFVWLKIGGKAGLDDFGLADDYRLVVSVMALNLLRGFGIDNADLEEFV